jgi:hypothetical protein
MRSNRFFNVLVAISLLIAIALTAHEALATASISSHTGTVVSCRSLPSRNSIHASSEEGVRVTYTKDGPTGVDGGLIELLSNYRTCSR